MVFHASLLTKESDMTREQLLKEMYRILNGHNCGDEAKIAALRVLKQVYTNERIKTPS